MYAFRWMSSNARARSARGEEGRGRFDYGTPDGYRFFLDLGAAGDARELFADEEVPTWNDYMTHGTYDEYWQSRNVPKDLDGITHPVLIVASWFDAQDFYGAVPDVPGDRGEESQESEHPCRRPLDARRMGAIGRRRDRSDPVWIEDGRVLPHRGREAVLPTTT